jgi:hypothetical protein
MSFQRWVGDDANSNAGSTSKLKQLHWKKFFKILLPSVLGTMPDPGQAHEIEDM